MTAPLSHLQVVECATFVAGPYCGLTMAQLGADVIRIDLPGGSSDHWRWPLADSGASLYWTNLNKGKRSVTLDYRTPEGRELLLALATRPAPGAGTFIDNLVGRHRVTHEDLVARRADAVSVHVLGFPDGRPAVDYTVNAGVGVPHMTGPNGNSEPVNHVLPAWDLLTGANAAIGLLSAVTRRDLTGEGAHLDLALADTALAGVGALGWLAEAEQHGDRTRHGNHVYGSFGIDFATADGHHVMVLALTDSQWNALCEATGTTHVFSALQEALDTDLRFESGRYELRETIASVLRPWFAARSMERVRADLDRARVLWGPYRTMSQAAAAARTDPTSVAATIEQPGVGEMLTTDTPLRWSANPRTPAPAPALGSDTENVLADLGLSQREIGRLDQAGVVSADARTRHDSTTAPGRTA